jgi:hypothetical protein
MKYFFIALSITLIILFTYDVLIKGDSFKERCYMCLIAFGSALAWYLIIVIQKRRGRNN